ncbi:MAG TPA: hypothetical protein VFZ17_05785 [Acidimicrobiia bacterium]|nr:hypothetical protein [Acidimicrobiia bacterium]
MQRPPRSRPHTDPSTRRSTRPRLAGLAALLAGELLALLVLVRLGRTAPFAIPWRLDAWRRATPEDALAAALRWVALAAAAWLLVVTVAYAFVARRPVAPADARWSTRCIPALVRRIVDGALVASVAAVVVAGPTAASAGARDQPPVVTLVRDGRAGDLRSLPTDTSPSAHADAPSAIVPTSAPTVPETTTPAPAVAVSGPTGSVVVAPGDDLWEIAARAVAIARGAPRSSVADDEIAPYWVAVCDANRERLQSRDVNLVFPGEVVELPPVS